MQRLSLNEGWKLHEAPLDWDKAALCRVLALPDGWMDCAVPCDVRMPLEHCGVIRNPVKADYCFESEWVEKRSWWFVREFFGQDVDLAADVIELSFESLDARADIFLNGEWLGTHISAFYPFSADIKTRVLPQKNVLAVRLTSGLEEVSDRDLAELNWAVCHEENNNCPERGDRRRAFVRKPAYTVGWDWGPKAITCGIVKDVYIRAYRKCAVRGAHMVTLCAQPGGDARLKLTLEIEQLHLYATRDCSICVELKKDGAAAARAELNDQILTSGINYVDMQINVPDAQLWWPNGYGEQALYQVEIALCCEDVWERYPSFEYGIRTVELDLSRQDEKSRAFRLIVNGVEIFCKGGDWIPSDSIYARVSAQKYNRLIEEARAANFNMLRVWGGGLYEQDAFYESCNRNGILLWHDFMFGCTTVPDHLPWFRVEVDRELDYQTRRLRNHACMALWCGNNENHWIFNPEDNPSWHINLTHEKQFGLYTGNWQAKVAVRNNCPEIPYWNSSPYGGNLPNADEVGDVHHWHACMMNPDINLRIEPKEYDKVRARFVSEYGYPGPCPRASIEEYFDGRPIDRNGRVWDLHNNTFEKKTVAAGIRKHYLDHPENLTLDEYILYAGMTQGLMLGYSLEAIRFKDFCGGALFWMYNDTWGEVGWTIVDYYLRRKISFYGVKRAFAPVKISMRLNQDGKVVLQGLNDSPETVDLPAAQIGYVSFDGATRKLQNLPLRLEAHSRAYLAEIPLPEEDYARGAFVVIPNDPRLECAVLRLKDTRELVLPGAQVRVVSEQMKDGLLTVVLACDGYAHGVHAEGNYAFSDNYFDLLPGQSKTVTVRGALPNELSWSAIF